MLFLSTDRWFSHLSEYNCEDLTAVVYYFLFCQMSVYFKGMRRVMKGTWLRTTKSEQNQEGPRKILWLVDLQVRVHDMHPATTVLLSNPPPPPPKGRIVPLQIDDRYPFKSTNLLSRGCVATEAGRPRIQRFAWQLILALDVNDLGDFALFVNPTRWTLVLTFLSHCWRRCLPLRVMQHKYAATERTFVDSDFLQTQVWLGLWNAQECDRIRI